jgi:carbon monoxide dehydrogenase subunit G
VAQTRGNITIDAAPAEVMAVIADFPSYPEWANGIKSAEVVKKGSAGRPEQVRFRLETGPVKDEYVLAYRWKGDEEVSWELVEARAQKSQHGSYTLTPSGERTDVTYVLAVDPGIPLPGLLRRQAEKRVIDTALKGLKKRVESGRG